MAATKWVIRPPVWRQILGARSLEVRQRVGRVVVLVGEEVAVALPVGQIVGALDGSVGAEVGGGEQEGRAEGGEDGAPLERHPLGHREQDGVALQRGAHGEADAGVAARGLEDGDAGAQLPLPLGLLDHAARDAVLHRAARVAALELRPQFDRGPIADRRAAAGER